MLVKIKCKKCKIDKPIFEFFKGDTCTNGFSEYCKDCIKKVLDMYLYK